MRWTCVQGDSTKAATLDRALLGQRADALVTDPPYCILTRRRKSGAPRDPKYRKIERGPLARFDDVKSYRAFTQAWLSLSVERLSISAPLVIWTNLLGRAPIVETARALGYGVLRGEFTWGKRTREGNSGEELLRVVETALVLTRDEPPPVAAGDAALSWAVVAGVDDDGKAARFGSHPSHKPFGVLEPLVRTWTRPDELVLDPFAGSGSIPAACLHLGRRVACVEQEEEWVAQIGPRLSAVGGQRA